MQEALRGLYKNYQKWTKVRIEQAAWMQEAQKQAQEQAVQINQLQMALKAAEGKGEQKRVAAEPSAPVREEPRSEGGFFRRLFGGSKA
ncbi:MAG: hypothetical protein KO206_00545 [Methanomicrobiaceae archaeon]|uniref:Uncharacterized protein n=1 Tax=hydrocarbon metagenome TaxID=938273 RepID=A0A0W8FHK0_9ZZZZ|nr:hypothetical protein [Methanomicrobiaceae archaeon]MDD5419703.1 hypothetical protein [Methanomicrobiaceae archaeon]